MLEPDALKGASPVLRRGRGRNPPDLFDKHGMKEIRTQSFRAFCVFRGFNLSVNIYVKDYKLEPR